MRSLIRYVCLALGVGAAPVLAAADSTAPRAGKTHFELRAEGVAAYQRKDYRAAREAFMAALAARPDSPRYLYNLAAMSALLGDEAGALDCLHRVAQLGVFLPAERDPDFAALQGKPAFRRALDALAANRAPRGAAEVMAELPGRTGLIEGIAFHDRAGALFLGDVHHRCIWKREPDGRVARFTAEDDELLGIFGLAIDENRNALWAATGAMPEMAGYAPEMKGRAALAEFDLRTGDLRRVIPVPGDGRDHALGDLCVAADGTVFATDSKAPVIWQFGPRDEEMTKTIDSTQFSSLQGIVLIRRTLVLADYANGLFALDLDSGALAALAAPKDTTLLGLDGLAVARDGLVATQNGISPQRLVHLALAPDVSAVRSVDVLAAAVAGLDDLTLITIVNGRPTCVAGSGWDVFDPAKSKAPPAHAVRIFQCNVPE